MFNLSKAQKKLYDDALLAAKYFYYVKFFGKSKLNKAGVNIAIFSSPRGGSTWLAQILTEVQNSALVWEPLFKYKAYRINQCNPFSYQERHNLNIGWNQFIPENAEWEEVENFFKALFDKEIVNLKLYRFNDITQLRKANTFIYKFCFGNNLLPWLVKRYDINPVFLLRHPCAVISSQMKFGAFDWHKKNYRYNYNLEHFNSFYDPYRDVLDSISCYEERLAAEWAMSVLTPAKHPENDKKWITICYEDLLANPETSLDKIFERLPVAKPTNLADSYQKQSFTKSSFRDNAVGDRLSGWRKTLSSDQIKIILSFVERMGVDFYSEELEPNYKKIYSPN